MPFRFSRTLPGRFLFTLLGVAYLLQGCANSAQVRAESENYNSRISIIVLHHTTANFGDSLHILTQPSSRPVSSHYLIPEPDDASYTDKELKVFQLVPETGRAWHAGHSYWGGRTALNDQSLGIEIVNQTYCHSSPATTTTTGSEPERLCFYPDFAESQMDLVIELLSDLLNRYPDISPTNIVGHSDIAPGRKIDPGPRFPWQRLYRLGFGAWFDDETVVRYWEQFRQQPVPLENIQRALHAYGYGIEISGELDEQTREVISAFQMHFRPFQVTGEPPLDTAAILYALIEKYFPARLDELLHIEVAPAPEAMPATTDRS
ncbi:MAG: N-acetylmuramoyl-L-alanine amidase [Woeseia sp.]